MLDRVKAELVAEQTVSTGGHRGDLRARRAGGAGRVPGLVGAGAGAVLGGHPRPALHRLDPADGATRTWPMPSRIGSFGLREGGGAVVALVDGFHLLDFDTGALTFLAGPERSRAPGSTTARSDPTAGSGPGRWTRSRCPGRSPRCIGWTPTAPAPGGRGADRLERAGLERRRRSDVPLRQQGPGDLGLRLRRTARSPGGGWSPGPTEEIGRPDGGAADVEGFYWSAGISAGVLNRWARTAASTGASRCRAPTRPRRVSAART